MFNAIRIVFLFCLNAVRSVAGLGNIYVPNANAFNSTYSGQAFTWLTTAIKGTKPRQGIVGTPCEYYYEDGTSADGGSAMASLGKNASAKNTVKVTEPQGRVMASQIVDFYYGLKDYMPTVSPDGNIARGIAAWIGKTLYLLDIGLQAFYVRLFSIMDLQTYQPDGGSQLQQWFEWCQEIGLTICVVVLLFYIIGVILAYNTSGFQRMKDIMYDLLLASFFLGALPTLINFATEGASSVAQSVFGSGYGSKLSQPDDMANQIVQNNVYSVLHKVIRMSPGSSISVGDGENIQYQPKSYLYVPDGSADEIKANGQAGQAEEQINKADGNPFTQIPNKPMHSKQVIINLYGMTPQQQGQWNGLTSGSRVYQFFQQYGTDADILSGEQLSELESSITNKNAPSGNSSNSSNSSSSSSSSSSKKSGKKSSKKSGKKSSKTILPTRLQKGILNAIAPSTTHAESLKSRIGDASGYKAHANIGNCFGGSHPKDCSFLGYNMYKHTHAGYKQSSNNLGVHGEKPYEKEDCAKYPDRPGCYHSRGQNITDSMNQQNAPDQTNIFQYSLHSIGRLSSIEKLGSFGTFRGTLGFADSYAKYKVNWTDIYLGLGLLAAVFISFIAKLVGTFFKAMVMYATAGIMIYKSIGSPSKIKYYIRTFFQLYEMLIMDVIMIKMYFLGYETVNSACNDIMFNHFPIPTNTIVLGIVQAACDIALFMTALNGVDAISKLLGQPTGSSDGWGKALMALNLGGMAINGAMGAARMGLGLAKGIGKAGLGVAGLGMGAATKLKAAKGVAGNAGGLAGAKKHGLRSLFDKNGNHKKTSPLGNLKNTGKDMSKDASSANKSHNDKNPNSSPDLERKNSQNAQDQRQDGLSNHGNDDNGSSDSSDSGSDSSSSSGNADGSEKSDSDAFGGMGTPDVGGKTPAEKAKNANLLHKISQDANGGGGNDTSTTGANNRQFTASSKAADNPANEIDSGPKGQQSDLDKNATAADQPMMQHHGGPKVVGKKLADGNTLFTPVSDNGGSDDDDGGSNNSDSDTPVDDALASVQRVGQGAQQFARTADTSNVGKNMPSVQGIHTGNVSGGSGHGHVSVGHGSTHASTTPSAKGTSVTSSHTPSVTPTPSTHPISTSAPTITPTTTTGGGSGYTVENPSNGTFGTITPGASTGTTESTPVTNGSIPVSDSPMPTTTTPTTGGSIPTATPSTNPISPSEPTITPTPTTGGGSYTVENPSNGTFGTITPGTSTGTTESTPVPDNPITPTPTPTDTPVTPTNTPSTPVNNPHQNDGINKMREEEQQVRDQMAQENGGKTIGNPFNGNLGTLNPPTHDSDPDFRNM